MSKKQRAALIKELEGLPPDAPRVLLATGKLVGEGFDHHPLVWPCRFHGIVLCSNMLAA
jgi:hypothetical protein